MPTSRCHLFCAPIRGFRPIKFASSRTRLLVVQEPGRANYLVDLVKSLAGVGGIDRLQRALNSFDLQKTKRPSKADELVIITVQRLLEREKSPGPGI